MSELKSCRRGYAVTAPSILRKACTMAHGLGDSAEPSWPPSGRTPASLV